MEEIWKDIEGYDGFYQVSNLGNIRSMRDPAGNDLLIPRVRKISHTRTGYQKIRLLYKGKDVTAAPHRLVAEAFIPNPNNYETVNHIDGNKDNNRVDNLEWCDRSYQMIHAYQHGLKLPIRGTDNVGAKLTADDVREIRRIFESGKRALTMKQIGKQYGVSGRVISLVSKNKAYQNVF